MVQALAGEHRPDTGVKKWNEYTDHIDTLKKEYGDILTKNAPKHIRRSSLVMERSQIYHEAYFMDVRMRKRECEMGSAASSPRPAIAKVANRVTPSRERYQPKPRQDIIQTPTKVPRSMDSHEAGQRKNKARPSQPRFTNEKPLPDAPQLSKKSSQARDSETLTDVPNSTVSEETSGSQLNLLRKKQRIERYFMEQQERQIININKTKAMNYNAEVELEELVEAVQGLTAVHQNLRDGLGVKTVDEIPNLIPVRKKKPRPFDPPSEEEGGEFERIFWTVVGHLEEVFRS